MLPLKRLGNRIRDLRIKRGFKSQEAFAAYCKMHRTFMGHLETGRKDFRLTTLIRVADALGVTLSELFAGVQDGEGVAVKWRSRPSSIERQRILKELATLESSVERLRALATAGSVAQARKVRVASVKPAPAPKPKARRRG
jgi:transcriptional regulator with XRE-family HTH domain